MNETPATPAVNNIPPQTVLDSPVKKNRFSSLKQWMSTHSTVMLASGILCAVLIVGVLSYVLFFNKKDRISVYAGTVTIKPVVEDTMGVDKKSEFILKSQNVISSEAINDNLAIIPEVKYDLEKVSDREYKIKPEKELNAGAIYQFKLATVSPESATASAIPAEKDLSWAFQIKNPFRIVQSLPGKRSTSVPVNTGIEMTFSHENFKDINAYFEITPKVEGRFERNKRTAVFVPKSLQPGTLYTVTIKKGVELEGTEEKLVEDYTFQFQTTTENDEKWRNTVRFNKYFSEFPKEDVPAFTVSSNYQNPVTQVMVNVYRFNNFEDFVKAVQTKDRVPYWADTAYNKNLTNVSNMQKVVEFNAPIQEEGYNNYFNLPQQLAEGYYIVETNNNNEKSQSFLQITGVATYLSVSETKTLVWVNDVGNKQPVNGATVEVIGLNVKGVTGNDGSVVFNTPQELKNTENLNYLKVTATGTQPVLVPLSSFGGGYSYSEGALSTQDNYWSYLYVDRPVYLPTDKVNFWGVVRNRDNLKEQTKLKVSVNKSDYRSYNFEPVTLIEKEVETSEFGTFIGDFQLTTFQPGYYSLSVEKANQNPSERKLNYYGEPEYIVTKGFSVETYTKPAYKIDLEQDKNAVFVGEQVTFNGQVSFFEGTAVPNVPLNYEYYGAQPEEGGITNDKGQFSITIGTFPSLPTNPPEPGKEFLQYSSYPRSNSVYITPKNPEEGVIEASGTVTIFDSAVSFELDSELIGSNANVSITANNIDLSRLNSNTSNAGDDYNGSVAGNLNVTGKVYEYTWVKTEIGETYDNVKKTTQKNYSYSTTEKFISDVSVTTDGSGKAQYQFPVIEDKYYVVALEAKDAQGRTFYGYQYIYGRKSSLNYGSGQSDYYVLQSNNKNDLGYSLNEKAQITMKYGEGDSPSDGANKYLFRSALRGIKDYKIQNNPIYDFEYRNEYIPNIVLKGVRFDGRSYYETRTESFNFNETDKELTVDVKPNQQVFKPRDKVTLDVSVKDKQGKGTKSAVNISLVDEAIFKLQFTSSDILSDLYKYVASGVLSSYSSHQLPLAGGAEGGGGCFLAGTKILTNGNGQKNIEDISVGDIVLTRKDQNSNELVPAKVINTINHQVDEYLIINSFLKVTPEHNLYVNGRWMTAGDIKQGDYILDKSNKWIEVISILNKKESVDVYNFTVEKLGTYFANNIYVHNDKGRELFMDQAFFGEVKTDNSGKGSVEFKLPDNLTSWRITSQAVSDDLSAGTGSTLLPVKLPFFVDLIMNAEYLEGDKPVIGIRTFGEQLKANQPVTFTIESPGLGINTPQTITATAFETKDFPLTNLPVGEHYITVGAKAGNLEDKMTRTIRVQKSHLAKQELSYQKLEPGVKVTSSQTNAQTTLIISDQNSGRFYPQLSRLSYNYTDRVDHKVTKIKSKKFLSDYFAETQSENADNLAKYQQPDGGIALFPYSESDLEMTVKIAGVALDLFDAQALSSYFAKILNDKKEGSERSILALAGLATVGQPVLVELNNITDFEKLSVTEKLYIGIAHARIGNKEKGREIFKQIMSEHAENLNPGIRLNVGSDQDAMLTVTAIAANLAALIEDETGENMFDYLTNNYAEKMSIDLDLIQYIGAVLPFTKSGESNVSFTIDGKKTDQKLEKGKTIKLYLTNDQLAKLSFDSVNGAVGLTTMHSTPIDESAIQKDPNISVDRIYALNDQKTTTFPSTGLITVELNYTLSGNAVDGCYQITDILPAGLKPAGRLQTYAETNRTVIYPYDINGQKVSFCVDKSHPAFNIKYYARVVSKGEYKAESTLIQSQKLFDSLNVGPSSKVVIQ